MKRFFAALAVAATVCAAGPASAQKHETSSANREAVAEAAAGFYKALNEMFTGDLAPMVRVWSHARDVTYMGPDGSYEVGWPAVRADLARQAKMKLGGKVSPAEMHVTAGARLAVINNYERGENTNAAGKPQIVSLRSTTVFRKVKGVWKVIGHHTDTLPYLRK